MQENQEQEEKSEEPAKKTGGGMIKEIFIYIGAMVVMTIIAVVVVTILFKDDTEGKTTESDAPESTKVVTDNDTMPDKDDPVYTFESPIVVNTADPEATRFLSVKIHIVFRKPEVKSALESSEVLQYQMRDLFITTFASKSAAELQRNEEKEALKKYLKNEMNQLLDRNSIKQVYFSEYVIQ